MGSTTTGEKMLAAFQAGQAEDIAWVDVTVGDLVVTVASEPLKALAGDQGSVHLPATFAEAAAICKALECVLPTAAIASAAKVVSGAWTLPVGDPSASLLLQPVQRWARMAKDGAPVDLLHRFAEVDHVPAQTLAALRPAEMPASFDANPVDLLQTLTDAGVNVAPVDGWEKRGRLGLAPQGVMVHHTAGPKTGDAASLSVCVNGRPGLSGPLCHILLGRDGTAHLVAANIANHAGQGAAEVLAKVTAGEPVEGDAKDHGYKDAVFGNTPFYGIEVENSGVGGDPYPDVQIDALVKICAALCTAQGWTADRIVHHRQWTVRKVDMSYRDDLLGAVRQAMGGDAQPAADAPADASADPS